MSMNGNYRHISPKVIEVLNHSPELTRAVIDFSNTLDMGSILPASIRQMIAQLPEAFQAEAEKKLTERLGTTLGML